VAVRWKAAVAAALLFSGLLSADIASGAPLPAALGTPGAGPSFSLPSYESSVCGAPVAGFATCHAVKLLSPTQYWRPGPAWGGPRRSPTGGGPGGGAGATPAAASSGYYPADLQSAYDLSTPASNIVPGSSAPTVAIVDAYDDPNAASDLSAYRTSMSRAEDNQTGLIDPFIPPVCSITVTSDCVTFAKVNQSGGTTYPASNAGWSEEISLDLDMVSAVCPACNIVLVEANSSSIANLSTAVKEAESFHPAAITNSYGGTEFSSETAYNSIYSAGTTTAITAATGDDGYGTEFPAVSPGVTAVGGTTLSYSTQNGLSWSSQAWADAGSGCSSYEAMPAWQADAGVYSLSADCTNRQVADVSADANPSTGVAAYDTFGEGGWLVFGGTSVSAQIIGATYALAAANGTIQPSPAALYPDGSGHGTGATPGLAPVSSGSNATNCNNYLCNAADSLTSGYNGPTGLGSPYGVTAFSTPAATSGSLSFTPTSQNLTAGVSSQITVNLSSAPTAAVNVTLATTSSGGGFSTSAGGPFTAGPVTLNIPAPSTGAAFYYEDTVAGNPTITGSAPGWGAASLPITVGPATLAKITVSPPSATVSEGGSQAFTATGSDQFGNPVNVDPSWTTNVVGGSLSPPAGSSTTLVAGGTSGTGFSVTATQPGTTVSGSASVAVTTQPALSVSVAAGSLSARRGSYEVPLTVTADNASTSAGVGGASVSLQVFAGAQCAGTPVASGGATTSGNGRAAFNFTTRTAGTWCALANVTASGYVAGAGQTSFST
jgi:hypothetical protein